MLNLFEALDREPWESIMPLMAHTDEYFWLIYNQKGQPASIVEAVLWIFLVRTVSE